MVSMTDDDEAMAESLNWFQKQRRSSHALAINVLAQCIQTVLLSKDRKINLELSSSVLCLLHTWRHLLDAGLLRQRLAQPLIRHV